MQTVYSRIVSQSVFVLALTFFQLYTLQDMTVYHVFKVLLPGNEIQISSRAIGSRDDHIY